MLLIYTGNGKGKTSACIGQAIRAYGQDLRVVFAHLMKSDQGTGEQKFLKNLLKEQYYIGGLGFFRHEEDRLKHTKTAKDTLLWCETKIDTADMLILDECLYALQAELITREDIEQIIDLCKDKHLVLSGRGLPEWLKDRADTVSEINEIKHACKQGVPATKGIEF